MSSYAQPYYPLVDGRPVPEWPGAQLELGGGTSLFVRRTPAPPGAAPAVFVHGLGGSSTNWTDLMYLLRDEVDGVAPDLPGFGWSAPPRGGYRLDGHVEAVVRLIEHRGDGPVHLFSNSMGGAIATRLAAERPELVRTLTLVSPALPDLRTRPRGSTWQLGLLMLPGTAGLLTAWLDRQHPRQRVRGLLRLVFADPTLVPQERIDEAVDALEHRREMTWAHDALRRSLRGLVAAQLDRGPRALWRQAGAVRARTLLVWGRQDRLVHPSVGEHAEQVFRDAKLLVLADAGHVAQMERPYVVAEAWRSFHGTAASTPG